MCLLMLLVVLRPRHGGVGGGEKGRGGEGGVLEEERELRKLVGVIREK